MSVSEKKEAASEAIATCNQDDVRLAEIGHKAQLKRQYGVWSVIALGALACNSWSAVGGSLVTGIYAGGPSLIVYGYIVTTITNLFVALSLAELASSYPTAGGAYHWAAVISSPKWARIASFFTGYLNLFAWIVGTAGSTLILGQFVMALANLTNPNIYVQRWMIFVAYQGWNLLSTLWAIFGNSLMPYMIRFSLIWTLSACLISIIAMLSIASPKQPASEVFSNFINQTGWSSNAIAAFVGLINPAFGYAAIDATVHYAEEIRDPERNIPIALLSVLGIGFVSGFSYLISAFFSINNYSEIAATTTGLPVVEMYRQACGQHGGLALSVLLFIATIPALFDCQIAASRLMWAFARDEALPFSGTFKKVNSRTGIPVQSSLFVGVCLALLGCIYIGNTTAFNAFLSSSIVLNNLTYATPVFINLIRGRKHFRRGKFYLGGTFGWIVNIVTCAWVLFTVIFFEFPSVRPTTAANMNYTSLILGACLILTSFWWTVCGRTTYDGPIVDLFEAEEPRI